MASGGAVSPLTAEGVQDLAARSAEGRFLAGLVLVCPDPADESASFYVVCNVVYARSGGFMFVAPEFEGLREVLIQLAAGSGLEEPGF